ncbi:hypothetical protein ACPDHL_11210 [Myroides sp. C15-4]|uniref:hypothetical protein n=1 Tax=Myroides sp. C15-4 TaxID=3400532 RepID=UPI003D2F92B7
MKQFFLLSDFDEYNLHLTHGLPRDRIHYKPTSVEINLQYPLSIYSKRKLKWLYLSPYKKDKQLLFSCLFYLVLVLFGVSSVNMRIYEGLPPIYRTKPKQNPNKTQAFSVLLQETKDFFFV